MITSPVKSCNGLVTLKSQFFGQTARKNNKSQSLHRVGKNDKNKTIWMSFQSHRINYKDVETT
jgi:hypothetical protein